MNQQGAPASTETGVCRAPRLRMSGVRKAFGATQALSGVDIAAGVGEVVALVGENGAGKSTLMKILSGAYQPDAGEIVVGGEPYRPRNPRQAIARGVAMIYQELSLAPHLPVLENIMMGMEPARGILIDRTAMLGRARRALEEIGCPDLPIDRPVRELPIAQQQFVEIARAVAMDCSILVLDEPTSMLPVDDVQRLFALMRRLRSRGTTLIYISHFLEEVFEIADTITVLRDGKSVGAHPVDKTDASQIAALMVGRELGELYTRLPRTRGETLLRVGGLRTASGVLHASLELFRGEILGIAGLVGSRRSELLRAIFGLERPIAGRIQLGQDAGPRNPSESWQRRIGLVSEDRKAEGLALNLSIARNLAMPALQGLGFARLVSPRRLNAVCASWIERLRVACRGPAQKIGDLSGGNQQKVAIARLLHAGVEILLLDEPTRGVDVGAKAQIYALVNQLVSGSFQPGRQPAAILIVSSYIPELLGVCDRVAVMCRGRLSEFRDVSELDQHRIMLAATGQQEL